MNNIMQINNSLYNDKSCYNNKSEIQYISMGVKPYYNEKYYECSPFDYYYKCPCDPCFRCCSVVVPTGPVPTGSVPPGPVPPVPPVPPGPVILGSAAFESNENLDDDDPFELRLISNDGIVNIIDPNAIQLLAGKRYSYSYEIEIDGVAGAFNVGAEIFAGRVSLPGSLVRTTVQQRPGVAVVAAAGIIEAAPNDREFQLFFISDIGALDAIMRLNIDEIA